MHRGRSSDRIASGPYIEALNEFWKGNFASTIEKTTLSIVADPESEHVFALYRLWIEALAHEKSNEALRELLEHLQIRGEEEPELYTSFAALRCLIHLELDEVGAAGLFFRGIRKETRNIYVAELTQSMSDRDIGRTSSLLASHRESIQDYIQFTVLLRSHVMRGDEVEARKDVEKCDSVFPGSPLAAVFEFHMAVDSGEFKQAGVHASQLVRQFPDSSEFNFLAGFANARRGNFSEALKNFESADQNSGEKDPDVANMVGYSLRELARRDKNATGATKDKATKALQRATAVLKQNGLPVASAALKLASLEQDKNAQENQPSLEDMEPTRIWLVRLSPRRFNEIMSAPEQDIEFLTRAIGGQARSGDLCFFAGDQHVTWQGDRRSQARIWQIGAIYAVMTDPMWHPTSRNEHTLQLVARPPRGIPVDVHYLEEAQKAVPHSKVPKDDASRFGTYEIGEGALTLITEAMTRQKHGLIGPEYEQEVFQLRIPS